jgi:MFS family permease
LFDAVFLMLLASSTGFTGLVLGYMGLQLSSNTAQGPLQGLMRDRVPHHQLGVASSMKVFLDLASLVAASLVAGRLITINPGGATLVMLAILGLLVASAAVTILFSPEQSSNAQAPIAPTVPTGLEAAGPRDNSKYWWLIGQRAAFLFGVYGLQAFGQYYIQDALGLADAPRQAGNLLAIIGTGTIALVVAGGFLADRFGARRLLYFSSALAGTGMLLMSLTTDLRGLYASGGIVGAGIGLFLTSNWALANQLAPLTEAGKFLGLTNLATAGAAALARLEGPAVDFLNGAHPGEWLGYKGIFLLGSVCIALSTWFLSKVR